VHVTAEASRLRTSREKSTCGRRRTAGDRIRRARVSPSGCSRRRLRQPGAPALGGANTRRRPGPEGFDRSRTATMPVPPRN
jgi:hypothetical protein